MSIDPNLIEELQLRTRNMRDAADKLDRAKEEVLRRKDDLRAAATQHRDALIAAAKGAICAWIREQTEGMNNAQETAFADKLGSACYPKWCARGGSIDAEINRMGWLPEVGEKIFGEHLELFAQDPDAAPFDMNAPDAEKALKGRAYRLLVAHLEDALKERYRAICGVWRADPADPYDWRKRDAREHSWRVALREHPTRYVTPAVFGELQRAGRVKVNDKEWARFSKCEWSFRNPASVDADIAKAIQAVDKAR